MDFYAPVYMGITAILTKTDVTAPVLPLWRKQVRIYTASAQMFLWDLLSAEITHFLVRLTITESQGMNIQKMEMKAKTNCLTVAVNL